jgi:Ca2+/Na+ antiporter
MMGTGEAERIAFQLKEDDLIDATRLHTWTALSARKTALFLVVAVIAVCAFLSGSGKLDVWGIVVAVVLVAPAVLVVMNYTFLPMNARRMYHQQKSLQETMAVEWADDGLSWDGQSGNSRTPWTYYVKWSEDRRLFLLYHSDRMHQILPKRVLSPAGIDSIRSNLIKAGVPEFRRFG